MSRWRGGNINPNCAYCRRNNKLKIETHLHLFFDCPSAYAIWRYVRPIIELLVPQQTKVQCFIFSFGTNMKNFPISIQRLIMTIVQLTLYHIWINRNCYSIEKKIIDQAVSMRKIKTSFSRIVQNIFKKMCKGNNLANFRRNYCDNNRLITLGPSESLLFNYP